MKLLQSSCSCSPQLALLLFPLQDFFPNLNIPRHLLNRPSEILVNWEVSQEGLCFQFPCSPSERLCTKPGKKGEALGAEELSALNYSESCTHLQRGFEEAETPPSSFSRHHLVLANGFSPSTVQFQWLWLCKKIIFRRAPRLSWLSWRLVQCNKSARLSLNPQGAAKPEHCRWSLIGSCKSPSLQSLHKTDEAPALQRSMCGRPWNSSRPVFNTAKALDANSFVKDDGIALLAKHVKLW